jgi:hypothetical protein
VLRGAQVAGGGRAHLPLPRHERRPRQDHAGARATPARHGAPPHVPRRCAVWHASQVHQ